MSVFGKWCYMLIFFKHLLLALVIKDILNLLGPLSFLRPRMIFFLFVSTNFCRRGNGGDLRLAGIHV